MDIQNLSDRQISDLINRCEVELMERRNAEYEEALTHRIYVDACSPDLREGYLEWLQGAGSHHQAAQEILEDHIAQQELKQVMRGQD